MTLEDTFENLSDDQKVQAKEAISMEEIEKIAKGDGAELSHKDLDAVVGGIGEPRSKCRRYAARCTKWGTGEILA